MSRQTVRSPWNQLAFSLKVRLVLLLVSVLGAITVALLADPFPVYDRPRSLFFTEHHRPPPRVVRAPAAPPSPAPPLLNRYTAERDYGSTAPLGAAASMEDRKVEGQSLTGQSVLEEPKGNTWRKPRAIAIIGDCSTFAAGDLRERVRPQTLLSRLSPNDRVAFGTVAEQCLVLAGWTKVSDAQRNGPSTLSGGDGNYNGYAPIGPFVDLLRDPACRGMDRIAVLIGDLTANNEDGHMLSIAKALANDGVRIHVIAYTEKPLPEIEAVANASGGRVIRTASMLTIGESLVEVQDPPKSRSTYRLSVRFSTPRTYAKGDLVDLSVGGRTEAFRIVSSP